PTPPPAWQRLARKRLGIGTALIDVDNALAYAIDVGPQVILTGSSSPAPCPAILISVACSRRERWPPRALPQMGIVEWIPLAGAVDVPGVRLMALRRGATPLGRMFSLGSLPAEGGLRMMAEGPGGAMTLDLLPPNVAGCRDSRARRFAWHEQDTPMSYGLHLWDILWDAGRDFHILAVGHGALDSMRLEKGYRRWGIDITSEHTPYEAGLGDFVHFDKGEFLGKAALTQIKRQLIRQRLCCLNLHDTSIVPIGHEPVYSGDIVVGFVTSANYSYSMQQCIAYAYLPVEYATVGTQLALEYFNMRYTVTVIKEPIYDPIDSNMRG
ncbi:MAG: aminomethyl transferase family protein, partial [Blastochloris sp.]|nr:aminomethyl transferase family protein [Blastochloris sp.]